MPEFLTAPFANGPNVDPLQVLIRLVCAVLLGAAVAAVYQRTTSRSTEMGSSFPLTLALLSVLIAMVTQVVGDNVARAFSLVGTLSIVRFRTVVRDTRDTAFVIFAVAVGMAVGARNLWVAVIGFAVVGVAASVAAARSRGSVDSRPAFLLTVRVMAGADLDKLVARELGSLTDSLDVVSVETAKQKTCLEITYAVRLNPAVTGEDIVKGLERIEGVQDVRLHRRGFDAG
jgi:hypothetical protein